MSLTQEAVAALPDAELQSQRRITGCRLFGFDTYKHEHRDRAARLRADLTLLDAEAARRGLGHELDAPAANADPRVSEVEAANARYHRDRFGRP